MARRLMVEWTCDGVACGKVAWTAAVGDCPTLPGDWVGTERVAFCPDHAGLIHAHRAARPASTEDGAS